MISPPAPFVDIGDLVLCARVMGQGPRWYSRPPWPEKTSAKPTAGQSKETLAEYATVLTYDRVGSGHAGASPSRTVAKVADDPDPLLAATGCPTPAVLVGWSAGGMVAEMFAARHPHTVAGLVLLDPTASIPDRSSPTQHCRKFA